MKSRLSYMNDNIIMTLDTKQPKEYKAEYLKEYNLEPFEPELVPWINAPQIDANISIDN